MNICYFAWLKEKVGVAEERVDVPSSVATVGQLLNWLAGCSDRHAKAFADTSFIRAAVNHEHVGADFPVNAGDEVAFFPPVTGG